MASTNDFATTYIKDEQYYLHNIKDNIGYRDVSRHIDTRKTKKALGIKGAGKLKVFITTIDEEAFDERANPNIIYKYEVAALSSHPLGRDGEWGFMATCPQGPAWVILPTPLCHPKYKSRVIAMDTERQTPMQQPRIILD